MPHLMKQTFSVIVAFAFSISILATEAIAGFRVVCSTEDIAAITREIGGDEIDLQMLARGYRDSHFMMAKPSLMVRLSRADMLIYQGMELEIGWLPLLIQGSRNPKIMVGQPGLLNASLAISPIEVPIELDRSMGDIHPFGNPHFQLDPMNGIKVAKLISDRLSQLLPESSEVFKSNLKRFSDKIRVRVKDWETRMKRFEGLKVVTYHRIWSYFFRRFGLKYGGTIEIKPGLPPTAKHLKTLVDHMKQNNIGLTIQANFYEDRSSKFIGEHTEAKVLILPASVGGVEEVKSFFDLFEYLVSQFEKEAPLPSVGLTSR
jgi:zinc/manganese transport system substrate-binding protein